MKTGLQIVYSPGSQENYMASGNYKKQTWDEWYGCAKAYYEEKGNLLVPGRYKTMDGYSLGRWIERQRARYNGLHDNMIHTDEVIALEKIGMVWKLENRLHGSNGYIWQRIITCNMEIWKCILPLLWMGIGWVTG